MTLANKITFSRLAVLPVFAGMLLWGPVAWWWAVVALFMWMELSDAIDGWVARRRGEVTELGKLLDPYVDAVCHGVIFLVFLELGLCPTWAVGAILLREMTVYWLRAQAARRDVVLAARLLGKSKTVFMAMVIALVVALPVLGELMEGLTGARLVRADAVPSATLAEVLDHDARILVNWATGAAAVLSLLALGDYALVVRRLFPGAGAGVGAAGDGCR